MLWKFIVLGLLALLGAAVAVVPEAREVTYSYRPLSVSFNLPTGNITTQNFTFTNTDPYPIYVTLSPSKSWITLSKSSFTIPSGGSQVTTATIVSTPGNYTATIDLSVTSTSSTLISQRSIPVRIATGAEPDAGNNFYTFIVIGIVLAFTLASLLSGGVLGRRR